MRPISIPSRKFTLHLITFSIYRKLRIETNLSFKNSDLNHYYECVSCYLINFNTVENILYNLILGKQKLKIVYCSNISISNGTYIIYKY